MSLFHGLRNPHGGHDPLDHHDHHHGYQGVHSVDKYMEVLYSVSAGVQVKIFGRQIFKNKREKCFLKIEKLRRFLVSGFRRVHNLPNEVSGEEGWQVRQEGMWDRGET